MAWPSASPPAGGPCAWCDQLATMAYRQIFTCIPAWHTHAGVRLFGYLDSARADFDDEHLFE